MPSLAQPLVTAALATQLVAIDHSSLRAQMQFDVTPVIGVYIPLGDLVNEGSFSGGDFLRHRQVGTVVTGIRGSLDDHSMARLDFTVAYSPSLVAVSDASATTDHGGSVLMASVQIPFRHTILGEFNRWEFHLSPGIGVVHRGGTGWETFEGVTDGAFVLGGGVRIRGNNSRVTFALDVTDYVSWASFRSEIAPRTSLTLHHDLLGSIGVVIPISR